jgi:hypothetical protein
MFTPDSLLELACAAEARYKELCVAFPAGTVNDERNDARRQMERAVACAEWMLKCGHAVLSHVGPFGIVAARKNSRARILKGARVFGTGPNIDREGIVLARAQVVTVRSVDCGYVDTESFPIRGRDSGASAVRQPRVNWSGTGSYWRWTDITNIEHIA